MNLLIISENLWKFLHLDFILSNECFTDQKNVKQKLKYTLRFFAFWMNIINVLLFGLAYGSKMFERPHSLNKLIIGFVPFSHFGTTAFKLLSFLIQRKRILKILFSIPPQLYTDKNRNMDKVDQQEKAFLFFRRRSVFVFCITIMMSIINTIIRIINDDKEFAKRVPYDTSNKFIGYITMLWMHSAHVTFQSANLVTEVFQYGLITHLSIEFKILSRKFVNIKEQINKTELIVVSEASTSKSQPKAKKKRDFSRQISLKDIKPLISEHNKLFDAQKLFWKTIRLTFHIRFFHSILVLCFLSFQITVSKIGRYFYTLELLRNLLAIFFQCYFCQMFKDAGQSIGDEVTKILWENFKNLNLKAKKALLMIIMRSQKSRGFHIVKISEIDLKQFCTILQTTYTYYTLCLHFYNN